MLLTITTPKTRFKINLRLTIISVLTKALFLLSVFAVHSANAELGDMSPSQPVIQFSTSDAKWVHQPRFDSRHIRNLEGNCDPEEPCKLKRAEMKFLLIVNQEGKVANITVLKSSGSDKIDSEFMRELRRSLLKPFRKDSKTVVGKVTVPIIFEYY
ncbi:energy transducer TonB [Psychrobacter immobilis]|uniref:energy transducer TonB n=1 Tax=Psychrobacter immobilis TaxID=498 RepID=UPI001918233A|nr:energy transducer TonB [Psychrobacter immobilis]